MQPDKIQFILSISLENKDRRTTLGWDLITFTSKNHDHLAPNHYKVSRVPHKDMFWLVNHEPSITKSEPSFMYATDGPIVIGLSGTD